MTTQRHSSSTVTAGPGRRHATAAGPGHGGHGDGVTVTARRRQSRSRMMMNGAVTKVYSTSFPLLKYFLARLLEEWTTLNFEFSPTLSLPEAVKLLSMLAAGHNSSGDSGTTDNPDKNAASRSQAQRAGKEHTRVKDQVLDSLATGAKREKVPVKLPPPPPGLTAKEVEKWRKQMAKLVKLQRTAQHKAAANDAKLLQKCQKAEDAIRRLTLACGVPAHKSSSAAVGVVAAADGFGAGLIAVVPQRSPAPSQHFIPEMMGQESPLMVEASGLSRSSLIEEHTIPGADDKEEFAQSVPSSSDDSKSESDSDLDFDAHVPESLTSSYGVQELLSRLEHKASLQDEVPELSYSFPTAVPALQTICDVTLEEASSLQGDATVMQLVDASVSACAQNWPGWNVPPPLVPQRFPLSSSTLSANLHAAESSIKDWLGWNMPQNENHVNVDERIPLEPLTPNELLASSGMPLASNGIAMLGDCTFIRDGMSMENQAPAQMLMQKMRSGPTRLSPPHAPGPQAPMLLIQRPESEGEGRVLHKTPVLLKKARSRTFAKDNHTTITVDALIPNGVQEGDTLAILHEGRQYCFAIPDGAKAGEMISAVLPNDGDSAAASSVEITVPEGAKVGDIVRFEYNGQEYDVPVPEGMTPGHTFMADVSPPTRIMNKNDNATAIMHDPLASQSEAEPLTTSTAPLPQYVVSDFLPKTEVEDWSQFLSPCKQVKMKATSQQMQRSAPPPPAASQAPPAPLQDPQQPPVPGSNKELTYGIGIQFEYDASSGTLCTCIHMHIYIYASSDTLCTCLTFYPFNCPAIPHLNGLVVTARLILLLTYATSSLFVYLHAQRKKRIWNRMVLTE